MSLSVLLTLLAGIGFLAASVFGVLTYRRTNFSKSAIGYVTAVAAGNAAFRIFTLWHRIHDRPLPSWATDVALTLQVGLAYVLLMVVALGYQRARNEFV